MPIAISTDSFTYYVCKGDRELQEQLQTKFKISTLNLRGLITLQKVFQSLGEAGDDLESFGPVFAGALKQALRGWDNFKFQNGEECKFQDQVKAAFEAIPVSLGMEIISECMNCNSLGDDEVKNSKSSPESQKGAASTDTESSAQTPPNSERSGDVVKTAQAK